MMMGVAPSFGRREAVRLLHVGLERGSRRYAIAEERGADAEPLAGVAIVANGIDR